MREVRVHVAPPIAPNAPCVLPAGAARHVARVLRLQAGAALTLFDGEGGEYAAVIESVRGATVAVRVGDRRAKDCESPLRVTLAQGLSRSTRMDYAIQKSVELGVDAIVPLATERSVVKLSRVKADDRLRHWREVVVSACEQCGRNRMPAVYPLVALSTWLNEQIGSAEPRLVLDPQVSTGASALDAPPAGRLTLLIGPEGGLSPAEMELAMRSGFTGLRLGPRVLRTETATVAALAALQTLWGDLAR